MSTGFHRLGANVPGKLPNWSNRDGMGPLNFVPQVYVPIKEEDGDASTVVAPPTPVDPATFEPGPAVPFSRDTARLSGYTGDQCSNCNSMRMKISGHCQVCESCGTTTGCS